MKFPAPSQTFEFGPFPVVVNDCVPKDCILILGEPDPIIFAAGQTEATLEQIAESYRRTSRLMKEVSQ